MQFFSVDSRVAKRLLRGCFKVDSLAVGLKILDEMVRKSRAIIKVDARNNLLHEPFRGQPSHELTQLLRSVQVIHRYDRGQPVPVE